MYPFEVSLLTIFTLTNIFISAYGFYQCMKKKNAFGETWFLYPLGIYVWGDATVFGIFWAAAAIVSILLGDLILFFLIISLFWLVRSVGETIYWFNQQFSPIIRMDPKQRFTNKIFHNDSIWFIFQIANQCLTVITIITSLYLAKVWLTSF